MDKNQTKSIMSAWYNFKSKIVVEGVIVGLAAGIVVIFYRYIIEKALDFSRYLYSLQKQHFWLIPIWFAILIAAGWFVGILIKKEPMISGSGIPQIKGILLKKLKMNWLSVVIRKFLGGLLCIGAGLSLGREGPSIQLGAAIGQGFSRLMKKVKIEEKYLITSGASAGLAAAFNAPLAGVIFALEELHKNFSPTVMISALIASISADFISKEFFGINPIFNFHDIKAIPLNQYFYLILLGIAVGLLALLFNKSLVFFQYLYSKQKWLPVQARPIIPFLIAGVLGLILPQALGSGHDLVGGLMLNELSLMALVILLIAKFLFTMVSYGSSAPGGIFLPLLVIGAIIGNLFSEGLSHIFGFNPTYTANFIILAMAGYFTAIVKAPITGIILITEMTGSFSNLLSVGVVCMSAFMITEFLNSKPIYDVLLERLLNKGQSRFESKKKSIIEVAIHMGSTLEGKKIKNVSWPKESLIVGIMRGGHEIIPNGETTLLTGDYLVVITNENVAASVKECLSNAAGQCND